MIMLTGPTVNPVYGSAGAPCADATAQHPVVKQVLGRSWLPRKFFIEVAVLMTR